MHMSKVRTTINLNEDVVKKAKKLGINISAVAERAIIEYMKELENLRNENRNLPTNTNILTNNDSQIKRQSSGSMGLLRGTLSNRSKSM